MSTVIHLVRHGEVHNPDRVLYGRMDGFRLSDRGQQMAGMVAGFLGESRPRMDAVIASPLLRAQQTADLIAAVFGLSVGVDPRLIEAGNQFEGTTVGARPAQLLNPRWWPLLRNPFTPSWGEPYAEQAARMRAAIEAARIEYDGGEVALVSHQLPIWVARLSLEGKRLWHDPRRRQCTVCSVTSLTLDGPVDAPGGGLLSVDYHEPAARLAASFSKDAWSAK